MYKAYQVVLECPKCRGGISLQRKSAKVRDSEGISCACGWRGKAGRTRVRQIVPFNWIFSTAS